ncbi:winged helix-turn-helix transcriptional regulator [Methanosarcina sp. UBA5]|uniref:winged helix-turn-helix transcriptional regulator n=1 Tax=Methanosarcina sp. UBA5 TaxID=1915593 RepID=UPI0025FDD258|nr:winged helix-turn-helix transcriptional regulator [Methanosarcina sp. UBA5]
MKATRLKYPGIVNLQKKLIHYLLFFLLISTAGATECIIEPIPSDQFGVPIHGEKVVEVEVIEIPYWQFLLWLAIVYVSTTIDLLYPTKLIFAISGYRIVNSENVLDSTIRFRIYTYIKAKPGAYINEIVERIGLNRETIKYHIKTLETQNKIEAYRGSGKTRFFENNFAYNEEEMKVISALQNSTNQRIISEILTCRCNTNIALSRELGVSTATISWYTKNLREIGLITETKEGRKKIYRINSVYKLIVEKYIM